MPVHERKMRQSEVRRQERADSCKEFLGAADPFGDVQAMRALHRAFGAVATAGGCMMRGKFTESLAGQSELAISLSVGENAQSIGDLKTLCTSAIALAAEAAI